MVSLQFTAWSENLSLRLRRELGLKPADPIDAHLETLAARLGTRIWYPSDIPGLPKWCLSILISEKPHEWSAVTVSAHNRRVIILNPCHGTQRRASDLAHELAHILIGHKSGRIDVTKDGTFIVSTYNREQEEEAVCLAGVLLVPRQALIQIGRDGDTPAVAARKYGVSIELLRYRINQAGIDRQFGVLRRPRQLTLLPAEEGGPRIGSDE